MHCKVVEMLFDANMHSRVDHDIALLCGLVDPLLVVDMCTVSPLTRCLLLIRAVKRLTRCDPLLLCGAA